MTLYTVTWSVDEVTESGESHAGIAMGHTERKGSAADLLLYWTRVLESAWPSTRALKRTYNIEVLRAG